MTFLTARSLPRERFGWVSHVSPRRRPGSRNDFLIPKWPGCTLHIVFRWKFHLQLHYSERPVTRISGKITIRACLLYRRYTSTMAGFLLAQATGWPLMAHCNSPVPQAIPPLPCVSQGFNAASVCPVCFQLIAWSSNKLVMMYGQRRWPLPKEILCRPKLAEGQVFISLNISEPLWFQMCGSVCAKDGSWEPCNYNIMQGI